MVWGVYVIKAWSAVFTGNHGVPTISIIFLILGCDELSVAYFKYSRNFNYLCNSGFVFGSI